MVINRYILCIKSLSMEDMRYVVEKVASKTDFGGLSEDCLIPQLYRPITLVFVPSKKYVYQSLGVTTYKDEKALVYSYGTNGYGLDQLLKDIEEAKKVVTFEEGLKRRYNRQIKRKTKRINNLLEQDKRGYGWHELGYLQGVVTTLEDVLDDLEERQ
ncbi:hypothetical protein NGDEOPKE_00024 [Enterococcus phage vB_OCPT_Carl]|uniref:Uncharacterized protein n=2 Tax=Kochikohdavirus TaxID=2560160 RepID=A0AAE7UWU6_9CAUD|nr:hypothetical protein [Enterococcus phage vB_EfaM_Ef2.1]QVW28058.1 hypothetical protein [Enterococcus phage MDA2]UQS99979.1 hypothetical protein NGDEOPKE_00024 [Enterococcus phage vB_OCPT_Carl]UQT00197.1 hypothetical protein EGEOBHOM_00038 [Enterococcus phage vB_OCPT_Car]